MVVPQSGTFARFLGAPRALRAYLLAFAAALVLPLVLLAVIAALWITRTALAANEARLEAMAGAISATVDREMLSWLTVLDTLATSELIREGDLQGFHERATAALRYRDADAVLLDTEFNELLNTRVPFGTPLSRTADIDSARVTLDSGRPYISDVIARPLPGRQRAVNVEMPIRQGEETRYILLISFNINRIAEIVGNEQPPEGWMITVADRKAQVIASNPAGQEALGSAASQLHPDRRSGVFEPQSADERRWVEAYRWSAITGWRTAVRVERAVLDAPLWQSLAGVAVFSAAAVALGMVLAGLLGRRMAMSMKNLRLAAADLAAERAIDARDLPIAEANLVARAIRKAAGIISQRSAALQASEEQSRAQLEQIRLLMGEMAHRNKNVMAVIQAIARQIGRRAATLEEFREGFDARIAALVRANDLLFQADGAGGSLDELIRRQLSPFVDPSGGRVALDGPPVFLKPEAAQSLGLALHELATNATKYGSLSNADGTLRVGWSRFGAAGLRFQWREAGGPPVSPPAHTGFGHVVIDRLTGRNLRAEVRYVFAPGGVEWSLEAPDILREAHAEEEHRDDAARRDTAPCAL